MTPPPCLRCLFLARDGKLRVEAVQPLRPGVFAPLARDGTGPCCMDCASADTLVRFLGLDFEAARIATANERQEQYRLPGGPTMLVRQGLMSASLPAAFDAHLAWLDGFGWFGLGPARGEGERFDGP